MNTRKITYTGLMAALVMLATLFFKVPTPFSFGYIHLGDCMIFAAVAILGWKYGAFAAGVGSMLADIIGGYAIWAVPTLIIKTLMAVIIGIALSCKDRKSTIIFSISTSAVWVLFTLFFKNILASQITETSVELASEMELSNVTELMSLSNNLQIILLASAIIVLVVLVSISTIVLKKLEMFSFKLVIGMIAAGLWMIIGYYFATYVLYGNYIIALFDIPFNLAQFIIGFVLAMLIIIPLKRAKIIDKAL